MSRVWPMWPLSLEGFGEALSDAMARRSVTVRGLAASIEVDKSAISRVRNGRPVSAEHFVVLWNWVYAGRPSNEIPRMRRALAVFAQWMIDVSTIGELADLEARMAKEGITLVDVGEWVSTPNKAEADGNKPS